MKYKAIFIDLDGTILVTLKDIAYSVNYSLKEHNLPCKTEAQILTYIGNGSKYLIQKAMDYNGDDELFTSVFNVYKDYYIAHPADFTTPYEGIYDVLKEFKDKGGKIALVSNKPQEIAIRLINKFFDNIFDVVYGQQDSIPRKPNPDAIYLAMKDLNITDKNDILYIGDSLVDLSTSRNAGVKCLLCNYGYGLENQIQECGNDYINHANEIKGYLY